MQQQMPQHQAGQTQQHIQQFPQMGQRFQDVTTHEQQVATEYITRAIQVCEWCANQCLELGNPNMAECIRLCEDVSELGEVALTLLPRNSRYTQPHLQTLQNALQACAQECSQHQHAHCQECAQVLPEAIQSLQQFGIAQSGGQ